MGRCYSQTSWTQVDVYVLVFVQPEWDGPRRGTITFRPVSQWFSGSRGKIHMTVCPINGCRDRVVAITALASLSIIFYFVTEIIQCALFFLGNKFVHHWERSVASGSQFNHAYTGDRSHLCCKGTRSTYDDTCRYVFRWHGGCWRVPSRSMHTSIRQLCSRINTIRCYVSVHYGPGSVLFRESRSAGRRLTWFVYTLVTAQFCSPTLGCLVATGSMFEFPATHQANLPSMRARRT
jgi:hypothetical protein